MAQRKIIVTFEDGVVTGVRDISGSTDVPSEVPSETPPRRHVGVILYYTGSECYVVRSGGTERKVCY